MKKLMVAGCSFSAASPTHPGTSWSELLVKKLGWQLVNLARPGCSNGGIRIQIEEIRRQKPDFAVVSATFWDRMELPAQAAPFDWSKTAGKRWEWEPIEQHLQSRTIKNGYNRNDGVNNINYGNNNYNMICETIFTLAENYRNPYRGPLNKDTQTAVRYWVDSIYDSEWKKQQDEWIIIEGILRMHLDNIKFLFLPNLLWVFDPDNPTQWRDAIPGTIPDHYVALDPKRTTQVACGTYPCDPDNDPGYHGNFQSQHLIADWWYERITAVVPE